MVMGSSQFFTTGRIAGRTMGERKAVPSRMARMVPLGDFHISVNSGYSSIRWRLGVMVAHFTATPRRRAAWAASTVIWSFVALRLSSPRS